MIESTIVLLDCKDFLPHQKSVSQSETFDINTIVKFVAFELHCCHYLKTQYKKYFKRFLRSQKMRFHRYANLSMQERQLAPSIH